MPILGLATSSQPLYPSHFNIEDVIRPNILALHPYRCARDDYQEGILLDANENSLGHSIPHGSQNGLPEGLQNILDLDLHRYPDPSHPSIKERIAELRGLSLPTSSGSDHIFLGVGSDEVIDLLIRVCVKPGGEEKILVTPPTYGMYTVCAQVNDVGITKVPLELSGEAGEGGQKGRFSVRVDEMKKTIDSDPNIKVIFLCSPGNPTGTVIALDSIRAILDYKPFKGIVVVDEAYIDFVDEQLEGGNKSAMSLVKEYANICIMQTLSKSFGLAAIRLGIAIAQPPLIQILTNTKAPYNVATPTAQLALSALSPPAVGLMKKKIRLLKSQKEHLLSALASPSLSRLGVGKTIGGNDANFLLVPIQERLSGSGDEDSKERKQDSARALRVYKTLAEQEGVVVRYRGNEPGCSGCLRITVGTDEENAVVIKKLEEVLRAV